MLDEAVCQVFKVGASRPLFGEPSTAPLCLMLHCARCSLPQVLTGLLEMLSTACPLTALSLSL